MEVSTNPKGYSIAYVLIVLFSVSFLIFYHPQKKYMRKKSKSFTKQKAPDTSNRQRAYQKDTIEVKPSSNPLKSTVNEDNSSKQMIKKELSTKEYFQNLVEQYKLSTLSKIKKPDSRTDLVIRYYKKASDENKAYALKEFGFYLHERPAEQIYANFDSNAIFYGDSVSYSDIQLIAYVLINAGMDLKQIALSKYHDTWKAHSVEIGTDTTVVNAPNIDLDFIRTKWYPQQGN